MCAIAFLIIWSSACPLGIGRLATVKVGAMMERTLAEHIGTLEQKLNSLNLLVMGENHTRRRNQLESELRAVESALAHYRLAFDIECRISMESTLGTKQPTDKNR